jgi:hypothetical protein
LHLKHYHPAPLELAWWNIAERFHWTPEVIDALTLAQLEELAQVDDGKEKAKMKGEEI